MRFTIIEAWFCITIVTLCTFVFGIPGIIFSILYVGIRAALSSNTSARHSAYLLIGIGVLLLLTYSGLPIAPNAARRMSSANDVAFAKQAVYDYVDEHGVLPWLDARHLHLSWRVKVLPYIDMQAIYDKLDLSQPWDSKANFETLADMKNPFPRTVFGSEVFCIRASQPPRTGVPSILLVEMPATPMHWAAVEKDPTSDVFLDHDVPSIHATQSSYSTFFRQPSGTHALLSSWQIIFLDSKLPRSQWQTLIDPNQGSYSDIDSLLSGEHYIERELRVTKLVGMVALLVFVLLHAVRLIHLRRSLRNTTTSDGRSRGDYTFRH